jgi:hypothetical protein
MDRPQVLEAHRRRHIHDVERSTAALLRSSDASKRKHRADAHARVQIW